MENFRIPKINPFAGGQQRPFWSVMIPTCGKSRYLEQTLRSVIAQVEDVGDFQIQIVENPPPGGGSTVKEVLAAINSDIILHTINEEFLDMSSNFNRCAELARGRYVHLLHDDDYVEPGFYSGMKRFITEQPDHFGIFVCNVKIIDSEGGTLKHHKYPRSFYSGKVDPGALASKLYFITPATVVKRECYERVGGYSPDLRFYLDSEMWTRTSQYFGVIGLDSELACYREHPSNTTTLLSRSAVNIEEGLFLVKLYRSRGIHISWPFGLFYWRDLAYQHYLSYKRQNDLEAAARCYRLAIVQGDFLSNLLIASRITSLLSPMKMVSYYASSPRRLLRKIMGD